MNKLRIIHLEDLPSDALQVKNVLKKANMDFEYLCAPDKHAFKNALGEFKPDLVLCDHGIPSFDSKTALEWTRAAGPAIPFILVTGTVSEEFAVEMMKEGVDDYILKDRLQRLPKAIEIAMERKYALMEREKYIRHISSQERKFRALIENSYVAIVLSDKNFHFSYFSASAQTITEYTSEEIARRGFISVIHADDRPQFLKSIDSSIAVPGEKQNLIFRLLQKNGKYIWLDTNVTNMLEDENVKALVINFRDVTHKKEAEEEVRRKSKHFHSLIQNISEAIVLINADGTVLFQSASVKRISGMDFEDTFGKTIFDFFHPDDLDRARKLFNVALRQPTIEIQQSCRMWHKNGYWIWVEGTLTNMLNDEAVGALIINYREITRRKLAEELLQKSEASLRTIFNTTELSYVFIDREFKIVSFNQLAKERYERDIKTRLETGKNLIVQMPPGREQETRKVFEEVLRGEKIRYDTCFTQADSSLVWYQVNIVPVGEKHQRFGLIISSEDITERKKSEMVRDKMTADILRHNKDLEQFAYIISHNLRAPVANIIGISNIMTNIDAMSQVDFNKCLAGLHTSVQKLDDVILDLNFILQARGKKSDNKEAVSFTSLLADITASINEIIKKENITIIPALNCDQVHTIRSYIHSIIFNLVTNAIKYRRKENPSVIRIETREENQKVILTVEDNGLGLDLARYGDKLFGLYKKFHTHIEGKGMGLYMVKTQVEMLGGRISVASEVNKGSCFTIELPLS
jgi:PAS domain S-box-containing protein